jgi:5-methylcytosine-specific restriction endonuclease McrA
MDETQLAQQIDIVEEEYDMESFDEGELNAQADQKITLDKADRSLSELHRWQKTGRIIIDPEWQRNYVWDKVRAAKLIESFLLDIPVPVVYLAKTENGKYEVIDGLQRLTSVFNFFDNHYKLSKLDILTDLNDKHFKDLPEIFQHKLEDCVLRSFELSSNSSPDIHFIVFERLNTGGVKLNDMEIRNCLYRGNLNTLIKELATNENFRKSLNQNNADKRMQDRALVLRFLAFYERTHHKCQSGLKKFLNEFLDTYKNAGSEKIEEYRKVFEKSMRACLSVFGKHGFRLKSEITKQNSKSSGEWASRPNAAIFQIISTSFANYDLGHVTRAADAIYEEYLDLIHTDTQWVDRVRRATGETTRLSYTFDAWLDRLKKVLETNSISNDGRRTFSHQLKLELFEANSTCAICGQRIHLIDDAVLDHAEQYWRGGQTVPENAQLAHRLCNLKKG